MRPITAASIEHSSAIRADGDTRHTYNRVPDYPVPGADPVFGGWNGGRITVSSSSSDSTAMPDVAPATSPAAAIDGDPATAWVTNALQSAVGQWLQVNFDHPVTNAAITLTPSATAVGSQVRRIAIDTATGSTTLRFDQPGKPLTAALPYGETPWVRITAAGTDDGSSGVQFGITDLSITQYDASGFAHPVDLRHTVRVPGPPQGSAIAGWDLGSELLGRPGCAPVTDSVRCAPSMALAPEEPVNFSRTLTVPTPVSVTPRLWVRPRQGPKLADLIAEPNTTRAQGDSDTFDILGSAFAVTDGDPATAWTAPQRVVQHKSAPTLTLVLPRPTEVAGVRLLPSRSTLPAQPTVVAVNLGDGPQVREFRPSDEVSSGAARPQTLSLRPRVTDTVTISLLDWQDIIDRNALGFDQLKPPGLAEVAVLDTDGNPIAPADAARNRSREIVVDCDHGPVIAVAGRFVHTSIRTTAGALLDGEPVPASPCDRNPIALPAGQQELLISPGAQFVVDGAQLSTATAAELPVTAGPAAVPRGDGDLGSRPSRGAGPGLGDPAGAGHPREHQSGLGGTHQHRGPADAGNRQRVATGLGGARGRPRHDHADLRIQFAVPGWPGRRAGVAAAVGDARVVAHPARAFRRPTPATLVARAVGRGAGAGGRCGDRRRGRGRRDRRRPRPAVRAAPSRAVARPGHHRGQCGRTDSGRGGTVPPSLAVGRRLRRPFRECATAGFDFACGGHRLGGGDARSLAQPPRGIVMAMGWFSAPDYWLGRFVLERGVAAIYLIAFVAAAAQFRSLIGEHGILPVPRFLASQSFWRTPSIFHLRYSDRLFAAVSWFGAALSAAVVVGAADLVPLWAAMLMWLTLWVLYLSIVNVGQAWYSFGWESLLLESGFLMIFLGNDRVAPPVLTLWIVRLLLFRVEFGAGLIKMRGDPCWRDLTCLYYHHETQPMPGPLSWFFHHLPKPLHRIEVAGNHFAQLVVPFGLFAPQPIASVGRGDHRRHAAVVGDVGQFRLAQLADDRPGVQRDRRLVGSAAAADTRASAAVGTAAVVRRTGGRVRRRGAVPDLLAGAQHAVVTSANEHVVQPISLGQYLRRLRQHRPYPPGGGDRGHRRSRGSPRRRYGRNTNSRASPARCAGCHGNGPRTICGWTG